MSKFDLTSWTPYAKYILETNEYKECIKYIEETKLSNVYISTNNFLPVIRMLDDDRMYSIIVTEHELWNKNYPLIENASALYFMNEVHRTIFIRSLPVEVVLPRTYILPINVFPIGQPSTGSDVIGFVMPDNIKADGVVNLFRRFRADSPYQIVLYTYSSEQYEAFRVYSRKNIQIVDLTNPETYSTIESYSSVLFTFDYISSSPFVQSLRLKGIPVRYMGDELYRVSQNPYGGDAGLYSHLHELIETLRLHTSTYPTLFTGY